MLERGGLKPRVSSTLALLLLTASLSSVEAKSSRSTAVNSSEDPGCKACISQAAGLFARNQTSEASELLKQWSARCPRSAQFHLLRSTILTRTGDMNGAMAAAAQATEIAPTSIAAHLQYGLLLLGNQQFNKADQEFERVTELDPSSYEAWSSLQTTKKALHQDSQAAICATKAANLEPHTKSVRLATLQNLKRAGRYKELQEEIQKLLASGDSTAEFSQALGMEALQVGAFNEAVTAFTRVSAAYPKASKALALTALSNYCLGDFNGCLVNATRVLSLDSADSAGRSLKAMALLKLNKPDEAASTIGSPLPEPSSSLEWLSIGNLKLVQGDLTAAEGLLQNCLTTDAGDATVQGLARCLAHVSLIELYKKAGKLSEAKDQAHALAADKRFSQEAALLAK